MQETGTAAARRPSFLSRFWPRSIRSRVLIVSLASIAVIALIPIIDEIRERDQAREEARDNIARASRLAAQAENERYTYVRELLVLASQFTRVTNAIDSRNSLALIDCRQALETVVADLPGTSGLRLSTPNGAYICGDLEPSPAAFNIADRLYFREAVRRDDFAIGQFDVGRTSERPTIGFALPLHDTTGAINAVLTTGLLLDTNDTLVVAENVPSESAISLLDFNGTVLRSTAFTPGDRFDAFEAFGGAGQEPDLFSMDGVAYAVTRVTDADQTGVYAVVSIEESALAPPLLDDLLPNLLIVLTIALTTAAILWLLIDRLLGRPVKHLTRASDRLATGDLSARVDVRDGTELQLLGDRFNAMAAELESRTGALQDAVAAKDEFLGLVSHELRTPITVVMGNARALQRRGDSFDEKTRREALEDIVDEGERLNRIITNLLVLARIERGQEPEIEPVHFSRTVERCAATLESHFHREIPVTLPDEDAWVLGESGYIEQVITNLVSNGAKYSPASEGIPITVERIERHWAVSVADRGPGIAEDERERIFDAFYRSRSTSEATPGAGIGLSVCKRLITLLHGDIWVEPRSGGGSVFRFTIPAYELEDEAADVGSDAGAPAVSADGQAPQPEPGPQPQAVAGRRFD